MHCVKKLFLKRLGFITQNCMVAKTTISTLHHGLAAVSNSETCALVVSRYIMSKLNMLMYSEIEMITEGPGIRVV